MPGLLKHSEAKPVLPPVLRMELAEPDRGKPGYKPEPAPLPRHQGESYKDKTERETQEVAN